MFADANKMQQKWYNKGTIADDKLIYPPITDDIIGPGIQYYRILQHASGCVFPHSC